MDRILHEQPRSGVTNLARIEENTHGGDRNGGLEIGIIIDENRRFTAKFKRNALQIACRRLHNALAHRCRSGERYLVDVRVVDQRCARDMAIAGYDVDDAFGHASFQRQFAQTQRAERSQLGRLDDHATTSSQRGRKLCAQGGERTVPRRDDARDTDRFGHRIGVKLHIRAHLRGASVNLGGVAGVIAQLRCR